MRAANPPAGNFSGAWQIFVYNWHFYLAVLALDLCAALLFRWVWPGLGLRIAVGLLVAVGTFWALASLAVSHYVYDRSPLYRWDWLTVLVKKSPERWVNIHAGLDQSSEALARLFPESRGRILDIYVASEMSEPSIERARRRARPGAESEKADPRALPLGDAECDAIFVIFAAHELRRREARMQFFREAGRALQPDGCVVLVEHMRDWKNFAAFGPGCMHFFSRRDWLGVSSEAGFVVADEIGMTPFVRCFVLTKQDVA